MDRADDEVQRRRIGHLALGAVKTQVRLTQLRTQLQPDAVTVLPHRVLVLLPGLFPVIAVAAQVGGAPLNGVHMVGEADLIQAPGDALPRHVCHGQAAVRRTGGVYMIISQIHQCFLKKLFRFS